MLGAAANGLDRSPHIALAWYQVPARRQKFRGFNPSSFVDRLGSAPTAIRQYFRPHHVSVTFDHSMRPTQFMCFGWVEARMDTSEYHMSAASASHFPNL